MVINLKNPTALSGLYFVYKGSVNLEKKGWYGISHFLEHIKCKAFDDLQDELQENGISWNAYTSMNVVVFYFTGLEENLAQFRDTLINRISTYVPLEEQCVKEKKIVLEEYLDAFTDQHQSHCLNFERRFFNCYSAIGLKEDIENFTYQDCLDFYDLQYKEPDMIINISNDYVLSENGLYFKDRTPLLRGDWNYNQNAILEKTVDFTDKTSTIWTNTLNPNTKDFPTIMLITEMLGNGLNSPLYQEVREKRGLVYYIHCYSSKMGTLPMLNISTMTSGSNMNELNDTIAHVLSNKETYLTSNRLEMVRKSSLIAKKKKQINKYTDVSDCISEDIKIYNDKLETITLDEVYEVYDKHFDPNSFHKNTDKELM